MNKKHLILLIFTMFLISIVSQTVSPYWETYYYSQPYQSCSSQPYQDCHYESRNKYCASVMYQ